MLKNTAVAEGIAKAHPLKRLGEGKDSAALAKFLITEDSLVGHRTDYCSRWW